MGFLDMFRRSAKPAPVAMPGDQAVITHLPLSTTDKGFGTREERDAVHELEERISTAVAAIGGDHDGDEFGRDEAVLYTYGPDADQLLDAIRDCLGGFPVRPGAYAVKRYGRPDDPAAREERVILTPE